MRAFSLAPRRARGLELSVAGVRTHAPLPSVTYSMNRLQGLESADEWCLTLNRTAEIDPARVANVIGYAHPRMTLASLAAQRRLPELNRQRTAFAGAWQGFGFHEDGMRSGVAAAKSLGVLLVSGLRSALYIGRVMHAAAIQLRTSSPIRST